MDHRSVALTWKNVVDGRPNRSSRAGRRHRRNVWCEWWSKTVHCSKVRGSTGVETNFPHQLTRPSVRTRRGSHPTPSGRPRGRPRKMTRFRYFVKYLLRIFIGFMGTFWHCPCRAVLSFLFTCSPATPSAVQRRFYGFYFIDEASRAVSSCFFYFTDFIITNQSRHTL